MKSETIKAIFTNLLFVIGIILLIFGFITSAQTATKMVLFDKYPLSSSAETRRDTDSQFAPMQVDKNGKDIKVPKEEKEALKKKCMTALEQERKVRMSQDIVTALSTLAAGAVLVLSFKRFIFK